MNGLEVSRLKKRYGGVTVVDDLSFHVGPGEIFGLIGPNGAGKSTTLKAITGALKPSAGHIEYLGQNIQSRGPWDWVAQGLVMVPEGRGVFARMSIIENLQMGAYLRRDPQLADDLERVWALFPRLAERRAQLAGTLSGGEQQMLAMGRALMSRPKVLLLDEPSMGLSPVMVDKIFEVIDLVSRDGVTLLLVEQNAKLALETCGRGYVLESGLIADIVAVIGSFDIILPEIDR